MRRSAEEYEELCRQLVRQAPSTARRRERPNSYLARSNPGDVARVEDRTFICSESEYDAGPDQRLARPNRDARDARPTSTAARCRPHDVRGAVLDGPAGLPIATSACSSRLRLRGRVDADHDAHGQPALDVLGDHGEYVPCMHSVGTPLTDGAEDVSWPCNDEKYIAHFPESREIWSYGSGYGGNALLGEKVLRAPDRLGRWLATRAGWPNTC